MPWSPSQSISSRPHSSGYPTGPSKVGDNCLPPEAIWRIDGWPSQVKSQVKSQTGLRIAEHYTSTNANELGLAIGLGLAFFKPGPSPRVRPGHAVRWLGQDRASASVSDSDSLSVSVSVSDSHSVSVSVSDSSQYLYYNIMVSLGIERNLIARKLRGPIFYTNVQLFVGQSSCDPGPAGRTR